jgi:hypothetical protein
MIWRFGNGGKVRRVEKLKVVEGDIIVRRFRGLDVAIWSLTNGFVKVWLNIV